MNGTPKCTNFQPVKKIRLVACESGSKAHAHDVLSVF